MQVVSKKMHMSLAALYIKEFFNTEAKKNVEEMVFYIQNELKVIIEKV